MRIDGFLHLHVVVEDHVAVVTFDPQPEGSIHRSFFTELRDVFGVLAEDPAVHAIVLTGKDDVFFDGVGRVRTARLLASGLDAVAGQFAALQQLIGAILSYRRPVVAAVNGPAHNIGGQIALLCDAVVAVEHATFGDHHVHGGYSASWRHALP